MSIDRDASLQTLADALIKMSTAPDDVFEAILGDLPSDLHDDADHVVANIHHFVDDAPIRRKDDVYRAMQYRVLHGLIEAFQRRACGVSGLRSV